MSNSSLVSYTRLSPNHSGRRKYPITKITPHYMASDLSVETCGSVFASTSRKASSNYGIGSDGRVALYVDEANRAWTSANADNDNRAVTIEVANYGDSSISDKAWNSLVALCADICRRNGIKPLYWDGTRNANLTAHKMFSPTSCPGNWIWNNNARLCAEVNAILGGAAEPTVPVTPSAPSTGTTTGSGFGGTYTCAVSQLNVRNAPSLSGQVMAAYRKGQTVVLDDWYVKADGYVWGRYTGASSGQKRYVAVGRATGKVESDDYLVKAGASAGTSSGTTASSVPGGTYRVLVDALNVRNTPSTSGTVAATYRKGQTVNLDGTSKVADGYVWGRYTSYSGKTRWIAVRTTGGTAYAAKA